MKNPFRTIFFLLIFLLYVGFAILLATKEVSAQSCHSNVSCTGPSYCNGPCNVLTYSPCNCSCTANYCENISLNTEALCSYYDGTWEPVYKRCTPESYYACSDGNTETYDCPSHTDPCINICDEPGVSPPVTSSPAPTLPPAPSGPPRCTIQGPLDVNASPLTIHNYRAYCVDSDSNLRRASIRVYDQSGNYLRNIGDCDIGGSGDECWGSTKWETAGTFYVVISAFDTTNRYCSGHPFCEYIPNPPEGLDCAGMSPPRADCYPSATDSDFLTVNVTSACNLSVPPINLYGVGDTRAILPGYIPLPPGRNMSAIKYSIPSPFPQIASFSPVTANSGTLPAGLGTNVTSLVYGTTTYQAIGIMDNGINCIGSNTITVSNPQPWWQVVGGDVTSVNGVLNSQIPTATGACIAARNCYPYLILNNFSAAWLTHPYPGIGSGRSVILPVGISVSTKNWNTTGGDFVIASNKYSYNNFLKKLPVTALSPSQSLFTTGPCTAVNPNYYQGFCIYRTPGDFSLDWGDMDIADNKIILFVDGNLTINSKINLNDGKGFLMVLAAGDIIVTPEVAGGFEADPVPDLEGLFFTQQDFISRQLNLDPASECEDQQLHVRGSVVAQNITLDKCLEDNADAAAELFEFAPDLYIRFPSFLGKPAIDWSEVEP